MQDFKVLSEIKEYKDFYLVKHIEVDTLGTSTTFFLIDYYDKYYPDIPYKKEAFNKEEITILLTNDGNSSINRKVIVIIDTTAYREYIYKSKVTSNGFYEETSENIISGRPSIAYKQYPELINVYK